MTSGLDLPQVDRHHGFRHWLSLHYKKVTWTSLAVAICCINIAKYGSRYSDIFDSKYSVGFSMVGFIGLIIFFFMYMHVFLGIVWFGYRTTLWKTYRSPEVEHVEKSILAFLWLVLVSVFLFAIVHR